MRIRLILPLLLLLVAGVPGCTSLSSDVVINPLTLLVDPVRPRGNDLRTLVQFGDYNRAIARAEYVDRQGSPSAEDLAALGRAEVAAGRFDNARRHLQEALAAKPHREEVGAIAWDMSQLEYLDNNFAASLEWAEMAVNYGMVIRSWHLEYLRAITGIDAYVMPETASTRVPMEFKDPDLPRVAARVNGSSITAVVDSGAVLSIVSETLARSSRIRRFGTFKGTFRGLQNEPIEVTFGLINALQVGDIEIRNVPVAIMRDEKLSFVIQHRKPYRMHLLLGAHLLKEFRIELSARDQSLTLTKVGQRQPADDQNLFFVQFKPVVSSAINGRGWYPFILDTGSEITFLNESELERIYIHSTSGFHTATLQGLGGSQKRGSNVDNVEVGVDRWGGTFRQIPLYGAERSGAYGIIGQNFLKHFRVTIDFGRMRVDLER